MDGGGGGDGGGGEGETRYDETSKRFPQLYILCIDHTC